MATSKIRGISRITLAIFSAVLLVFFLGSSLGCGNGTSPNETKSLNASVSFDGAQFIITNNDTFAWTNVILDVNYSTWSSGYTKSTPRMNPGVTYTVGAAQFTDSSGKRFNPFTHKPEKIKIEADQGVRYMAWD